MFYYLYSTFASYFTPFNIFQYISFRSAGALLTGLLVSYFIGLPIIQKLRYYRINQAIRDDGPKTHLDKKGTPTMGGIIIILSVLIASLVWAKLTNRFIVICLISTIYLGAIGFCDDYLKLVKKNTKGLAGRKKLILQFIFALAIGVYFYFFPVNNEYSTHVNLPYFKLFFVNLGIFYLLFSSLVVVGSSNAVNLTDGLDGLAIGLIMISAFVYIVFAYLAGHVKFSSYLGIVHVAGAGELVVYLSALIGSGLGFLWYNAYPAQVFMGDTGSLFLGGILGVVAVIVKQELLLVIVGGLFVVEAVSVMIQVYFFRNHGGIRIFKMAPIHHHYELCGWHETKVVVRFWIIGIILGLIALSALKIR